MFEHMVRDSREKYFEPVEAKYTDLVSGSECVITYQPTIQDVYREQDEYNKPFGKENIELMNKLEDIIDRLASFGKRPTIKELEHFHKTGSYAIL